MVQAVGRYVRPSAGNERSAAGRISSCTRWHSQSLPCRRIINKQRNERSDGARHSAVRSQLQSGSPAQSSLSLSLPSAFHRFFFLFGLLPFNSFDDRDIDTLPGGRPRRRSDVDSLCREDDGRKRDDGVEKPPGSAWHTHNSQHSITSCQAQLAWKCRFTSTSIGGRFWPVN